jgi:hypothetical protein
MSGGAPGTMQTLVRRMQTLVRRMQTLVRIRHNDASIKNILKPML